MGTRFHTFTANLLWETTYYVDSWEPGRTERASHESVQVGGKGINVSKMLNRLGATNEAICFPGGAVGAQCVNWLTEHQFGIRPFYAERESRTGFVVRSADHPETTFLGTDRPVDEAAVAACCEHLAGLREGDALVVCGSIPGWNEPVFDPLRKAFNGLFGKVFVAVDTYGPPLAWFAGKPVGLIKVNDGEFRELRNGEDPSVSLAGLAKTPLPPRAWIVTDGGNAVKGFDAANGYWEKSPPPVDKVSPVGSGDIFLAALLHAHLNHGLPLPEAADEAIPPAAANTATPGIADYPEELAESLRQEYRALLR